METRLRPEEPLDIDTDADVQKQRQTLSPWRQKPLNVDEWCSENKNKITWLEINGYDLSVKCLCNYPCNFYFLTDKGADGFSTCHIENAHPDATHIVYTCNCKRPHDNAWCTFRLTLERKRCDVTSFRNHIDWKLNIHRHKQEVQQLQDAYRSGVIIKSPRDWIEDSLETRPLSSPSHHSTVLNWQPLDLC